MEAAPVTKKGRGKRTPMAQAGSEAKGEKAKTTTKTTKKKR
jgi:hypothetical protein